MHTIAAVSAMSKTLCIEIFRYLCKIVRSRVGFEVIDSFVFNV